jgi:hypothetical protein
MPFIETADRTQLFYTDGGLGKPVVFGDERGHHRPRDGRRYQAGLPRAWRDQAAVYSPSVGTCTCAVVDCGAVAARARRYRRRALL